MAFPVAMLDHVVINARDDLDHAADTYRRLGFTLTPRGYHSLGSMNHLAMFGNDFLELIAVPKNATIRRDLLSYSVGLFGLAFGTEDSTSTYGALCKAGVPVVPPLEFVRPVDVDGAARDARFRTLGMKGVRYGQVFFVHHFTRDLLWRDEWRHHANGAVGVDRAVIAARDPASLRALFIRMFGDAAVRQNGAGCSLAVGLSRFDLVTPGELAGEYGDAAPGGNGRDEYMAALTIRTRSLDAAAAALQAGGIAGVRREADRIVVPASATFGVTLEFRA
jgi:glyoxalase-like protein